MITIVEKAWKMQNRIEQRLLRIKNRFPNEDTLCWRRGDLTLFLSGLCLFFGLGIFIIFNFNTDWWLVPCGISEVFLFLFVICKKVEGEEND